MSVAAVENEIPLILSACGHMILHENFTLCRFQFYARANVIVLSGLTCCNDI